MTGQIADRVHALREEFTARPDLARKEDVAVTVHHRGALGFRATDAAGRHVATDMPAELGGEDRAMTPGTLLRAALGTCDATTIALEAAARGIELSHLEVEVTSTSDHRGLLGVGEVVAGPEHLTVHYRLAASDASEADLDGLVAYADRCSPVASALRRIVPVDVSVEVA